MKRIGNGSSKYDYQPELFNADHKANLEKSAKFKSDFTALIKGCDLSEDTKKSIVIDVMYELLMIKDRQAKKN